jgi:hypothetical protein
MSHGSLDKTVVQMKRKAPPDPESASAKQPKDDARDLRLYNCAQCQCTCWGLQQLANHVLRAHGPTSLLGGQFPGSEGKVPYRYHRKWGNLPRKYRTCTALVFHKVDTVGTDFASVILVCWPHLQSRPFFYI